MSSANITLTGSRLDPPYFSHYPTSILHISLTTQPEKNAHDEGCVRSDHQQPASDNATVPQWTWGIGNLGRKSSLTPCQ